MGDWIGRENHERDSLVGTDGMVQLHCIALVVGISCLDSCISHLFTDQYVKFSCHLNFNSTYT
jgi:hypothetical protein